MECCTGPPHQVDDVEAVIPKCREEAKDSEMAYHPNKLVVIPEVAYDQHPPPREDRINDEGAHVEIGLDGETWYCGRVLGKAAIPGSNGQCGPKDGKQCASCLRCQSGHFGITRRVPECRAHEMPHESPFSPGCQKIIHGGSCLIILGLAIWIIYELATAGPTPARATEGMV